MNSDNSDVITHRATVELRSMFNRVTGEALTRVTIKSGSGKTKYMQRKEVWVSDVDLLDELGKWLTSAQNRVCLF